MDSGTPIDVIYLDFKKAFDTVPHQRLLEKLKVHSVTGKLLEWIQYFDNLVEWSNKWQLVFNKAKCKSLHLGSSNQRLTYQMNSQLLEESRNERDLGVYIEEELKFHGYASKTVAKASHLLGLIRATFTCLDNVTMPRHFTVIV